MHRIATNSMLSTFKRCRRKYHYAYREQIAPARASRAPSFGSLFHMLYRELLTKAENADFDLIVGQWKATEMASAQAHYDQVKTAFGFEDQGIMTSAEERVAEVSTAAMELINYYHDSVWVNDRGTYRVLFAEQAFDVPLIDRGGRRSRTWRLNGKWDVVVQYQSGRIVIRDVKTTARSPDDFATLAELDTQPVSYLFAGKYLATRPRPELMAQHLKAGVQSALDSIAPDAPFWPTDWSAPSGFEFEVIRKKVPKKPETIKDGSRLSKAVTDTTYDLYMQAIKEHKFNPNDYSEILEKLQKKGPTFHLRQEVSIGHAEIERWLEETRMALEDVLWLDRHPDRFYRTDPQSCQMTWGRRCSFHSLCYGDESVARADFISRAAHAELADEGAEQAEASENLGF